MIRNAKGVKEERGQKEVLQAKTTPATAIDKATVSGATRNVSPKHENATG